jgi:hypothetical protein
MLVALENQRGLHYPHSFGFQCFIFTITKTLTQCSVAFPFVRVLLKGRVLCSEGFFSSCVSQIWKKETEEGKKHFSNATFSVVGARQNEDENWEGFLLTPQKKMEMKKVLDLWNRKRSWRLTCEGQRATVKILCVQTFMSPSLFRYSLGRDILRGNKISSAGCYWNDLVKWLFQWFLQSLLFSILNQIFKSRH